MPAVPDANKGSERRTLAIRLGTVSFGAALEEEDRERQLRVERILVRRSIVSSSSSASWSGRRTRSKASSRLPLFIAPTAEQTKSKEVFPSSSPKSAGGNQCS